MIFRKLLRMKTKHYYIFIDDYPLILLRNVKERKRVRKERSVRERKEWEGKGKKRKKEEIADIGE